LSWRSCDQVAFASHHVATINSYGYSPHPLGLYIAWIEKILEADPGGDKPFIVSVAASQASDLYNVISMVTPLHREYPDRIALEFNTSCPNIQGSIPLGYDFENLWHLLRAFEDAPTNMTIGLKLPPYTFTAQFTNLLKVVLDAAPEKISFFTCTNTLGNSLLFADQVHVRKDASGDPVHRFAVPTELGGLAGELLHPLALGNVHSFKQLLDAGQHDISIIGVGGVTSPEAGLRMKKAGASVLGCATLLGKEGVNGFMPLLEGMDRIDRRWGSKEKDKTQGH
jgi:dihydroorotate dehydrogenase (fumarate)